MANVKNIKAAGYKGYRLSPVLEFLRNLGNFGNLFDARLIGVLFHLTNYTRMGADVFSGVINLGLLASVRGLALACINRTQHNDVCLIVSEHFPFHNGD
jgi:hypothetical protein